MELAEEGARAPWQRPTMRLLRLARTQLGGSGGAWDTLDCSDTFYDGSNGTTIITNPDDCSQYATFN